MISQRKLSTIDEHNYRALYGFNSDQNSNLILSYKRNKLKEKIVL